MTKQAMMMIFAITAAAVSGTVSAQQSSMGSTMDGAGKMVMAAGEAMSSGVQKGLTSIFGSAEDKAASAEEQKRRQIERNEKLWQQTGRYSRGN